jgi:hypothetical protein
MSVYPIVTIVLPPLGLVSLFGGQLSAVGVTVGGVDRVVAVVQRVYPASGGPFGG